MCVKNVVCYELCIITVNPKVIWINISTFFTKAYFHWKNLTNLKMLITKTDSILLPEFIFDISARIFISLKFSKKTKSLFSKKKNFFSKIFYNCFPGMILTLSVRKKIPSFFFGLLNFFMNFWKKKFFWIFLKILDQKTSNLVYSHIYHVFQ